MEPAYIILAVTVAAVGTTVMLTFTVRISNLITDRRLSAYQATIREWFTQYAVGAREDPPPPANSRMERKAMRGNARALSSQVTGAAAVRVSALFAEYGFVEAVRHDLDSRNPLKRIRASDTLGTLRLAEAVPWLRDHLHDDPLLRLSCARALADLDDLEALPAIISSLSEYHSSLVEVTDIVCAFGQPAVPVLREFSRSGRREERRLAARALGQMRAREAVPELRAAMDSSDDELAAAAARALGRIDDVSSVPDLARVLASERVWFVRVAAAHALGNIHDGTTPAVLVEALGAPGWYLRDAAAGSLQAMGEVGLDAVIAVLDDVPDRGIAHFAGLLDVADQLDSVIDRAASGDEQLERFVQRACAAGVHARLDGLAGADSPRAAFCARVLAGHRPVETTA